MCQPSTECDWRHPSPLGASGSELRVFVERDFARWAVGSAQKPFDVAHGVRAEYHVAAYRAYFSRHVVNDDDLAVVADRVRDLYRLTFAAAVLDGAFHSFLLTAGSGHFGGRGSYTVMRFY